MNMNWDNSSIKLFCHWLNQVWNNIYRIWWEGDCKEHIVDHGCETSHSKFIELIDCLYPNFSIFRKDEDICYNADIPNGIFTMFLGSKGELIIEGIDSQFHHTYLVNYYEKEKNENVRSEES